MHSALSQLEKPSIDRVPAIMLEIIWLVLNVIFFMASEWVGLRLQELRAY